jgi:hypothetical protein
MKTQIFTALLFAFTLNQTSTNATTHPDPCVHPSDTHVCVAETSKGGDPTDIKIVVSQKRIWFVTDEMPMKCLKTVIKNAAGKVVFEQCFSSKSADWFVNIENLPKGLYTLFLGDREEQFKK